MKNGEKQLITAEEKRISQIERIKKALSHSKPKGYIAYLVIIICLVYITDELASNICTQMKTEIAHTLFGKFGDSSLSKLELLGMISYPCMALSLFYRTLSDRFGRKPFLIINTLGMGLGMFIIFISSDIFTYILGYCIISFFVPHDMQVVYIMETAPAKHRAKIYSIIKCLSTLGVMLIPLFRRMFMTQPSQWRSVFIIPAIIGLISAICALLLTRETDAFLENKLHMLTSAPDNAASDPTKASSHPDKAETAQGGFFTAFKFSMKHPQLRRLNILMGLFNLGFIITMYYQVMISYGYAGAEFSKGLFSSIDLALDSVSTNEVTQALFLFPIGSALVQLSHGFFSDRFGRKTTGIIMAVTTVLSFIGFLCGARFLAPPYLTGFLAGVCVGSFWGYGDINVMMMSESAPTNLRSSVLSACYVIGVIGTFTGMGILLPLISHFGNGVTAIVTLCIAVPGIIASIFVLLKTHETKGTDIEKVTGFEFDEDIR